jgi:CheY-like chemotaxis protein
MVVNDEIRDLISKGSPEHLLREAARRGGMQTLMEDALSKAAKGMTTLEEVVRVAPPDDPQGSGSAPPRSGDPAGNTPIRASVARGTGDPDMGTMRVLVVDDNATVASVVKYFLELEGFEVLLAQDGEAGLQLARREHPDVVVTDVNMPRMGGMEMVAALRKDPATREVAILMLTSEDSVESEAMGLSAGADDYILKPVEPRQLAARVKALMARARGRQTAPA